MIHIEMFPACAGDSFLLSMDKTHLLIDAGFTKTYDAFIKPRLQTLKEQGECLELVVITHIDQDHIEGVLKLLKDNGLATNPALIPIRQIWHNAYKHLPIEKTKGELSKKGKRKLESIKAPAREAELDAPISAKQGSVLAKDILKNAYAWNADFDGNAVSTSVRREIQLTPTIKITLLSPTNMQLSNLLKRWRDELYKMGFREQLTEDPIFDDAFELLLREVTDSQLVSKGKTISTNRLDIDALKAWAVDNYKPDNAAPNGSSIAFLLESDRKRLLFLADAHAEVIEQSLDALQEPFPIYFDVIKVAHHGSFFNNNPKLWEKIDSDCFLISTDGKDHEHPSPETLALIVNRPTDKTRHLYFNYATKVAQSFDNELFMKQFNYQVHIKINHQSTIISL